MSTSPVLLSFRPLSALACVLALAFAAVHVPADAARAAKGKESAPAQQGSQAPSEGAASTAPVPGAGPGVMPKTNADMTPEIAARSWILVDVTTRTVMLGKEPDMRIEPASLTKLMTAYIVFNAIRDKRLAMDTRPPVSMAAYKMGGSRMFIDPNVPATVDELLRGLIIQSGNDAATVLAEAVGGSEQRFADMMNAEAKRIGMNSTHFTNASGWPDANHYTTARDLATLAVRIITDHQDHFKLYSEKEYTYNKIRQPNRNRLLFSDPSVDGMKTGHTEAAGYCLVSTARRTAPGQDMQRRVLAVLIGANSESSRAIESQKLLNFGFQDFDLVRMYKAGDPVGPAIKVWKGAAPEVRAGFQQDVLVTAPRAQVAQLRGDIERVEPLVAPITKGQKLGTLRVKAGDKVVAEKDVIALDEVAEGGFVSRAWDSIQLWWK